MIARAALHKLHVDFVLETRIGQETHLVLEEEPLLLMLELALAGIGTLHLVQLLILALHTLIAPHALLLQTVDGLDTPCTILLAPLNPSAKLEPRLVVLLTRRMDI